MLSFVNWTVQWTSLVILTKNVLSLSIEHWTENDSEQILPLYLLRDYNELLKLSYRRWQHDNNYTNYELDNIYIRASLLLSLLTFPTQLQEKWNSTLLRFWFKNDSDSKRQLQATATSYLIKNASYLPTHSKPEKSKVLPLKIQLFLTTEHLFSFCVHCSLFNPERLAILTFLFKSSST